MGKWLHKENFIFIEKNLYTIDNCCIVEKDLTGITVEICLNEHRELLEDLTNSFFIKNISTRKVEEKIGHACFVGNPFLTIKIYNGFRS